MPAQLFEIIYLGSLREDADPESAIVEFAALAKLSTSAARTLIEGPARIIKKAVPEQQLAEYIEALNLIGMQIEVKSLKASSAENQTIVSENAATSTKTYPFEFRGQAGEYFKIWIVNIFLTIISLGIYSPWAKVRNTQYFYSNTLLADSSFNYTANPVAILKGRLIAVGLFLLYYLGVQFYPVASGLFVLIFMPLMPWLVIKSLAFNARNSMYRNVAFNFNGNYWQAAKIYLLLPVLIFLTLGLILPYLWYRQQKFHVEHSTYGTTNFEFHGQVGEYWHFTLIAMTIVFVTAVVSGILGLLLNMPFIAIPIIVIAYAYVVGYIYTARANILFNCTRIADISFLNRLETKQMIWIFSSNTLAILLSLGLLIPWAQVRLAQYRAQCLSLTTTTSLDQFTAAEQQEISALGEQMGEVFDMDISII